MSDPLNRDPEDINYNLPEESDPIEEIAEAIEQESNVEPLDATAHDDE